MSVGGNKVQLSLTIVAGAALASGGFLAVAPNRLVSGRPLMLWQAATMPTISILGILVLALAATALMPQTRISRLAVPALSTALLLFILYAAGASAATLAHGAAPATRISLGAAFWIASLCAALAIVDGLQRLGVGPATRLVAAAAIPATVAAMALAGSFDDLSILREYANRRAAFSAELVRHIVLVLAALLPALLIGAPLGLLAARLASLRAGIFAVLDIVETIPSVALFGLLIAPLTALALAVPPLGALGVSGIGPVPAVIALVLYALLPMARNTYAGITGIDRAVIETASGMGFTKRQIFWNVELPLAMPVFLAGIRIVVVQTIGLAVVAALIGAGGLGTFVFQGIGQYAVDLVLLGAIPSILLALAADFLLALLVTLTRRRNAP
jgi:osmoprotectant transport system permease protein